ncbi:MAPK/MAK/MRK overlapping kinase-like [Thrips palmi]|uniref:MAPK/MAK/MRK overlapping kinase-like n=1 Tax=Thrips palmi TaxID=161013 RepID=A0A6P8Z085_THRPL|nr:MAPK/MAK/MRK overlapping kinase-like [Thrips palmi]
MAASFYTKYEVLCKIGEGSFSEVLKCQDRNTGQLFAAKRLRNAYRSPVEAANIPEVVAARKLKPHANVLHLLEQHYDVASGSVTLIFELMERCLYELLQSRVRTLPEVRVRSFLYQLLQGCEHLHGNGIFHRDVKPENILVKGDCVKLGDLGSIRGSYSKPPYTEYISTRWYRSPECLLTTGFYGPKMDIWAAGCVFYEMLTLKPLFPGSNEADQLAKIHGILGSPHPRLYAKLRRHWLQSRSLPLFPDTPGCGLGKLVPSLGESGRDLLRLMLLYDPDQRAPARRLLRHSYFADLRSCGSAASSMSSVCTRRSVRSVQRAPSRDPVMSLCSGSGSGSGSCAGTTVNSGGDRARDVPRTNSCAPPSRIPMRRGCSTLQQAMQQGARAHAGLAAPPGMRPRGYGQRSCSTSFLPRVPAAHSATLHAIAEAQAQAQAQAPTGALAPPRKAENTVSRNAEKYGTQSQTTAIRPASPFGGGGESRSERTRSD